MINGMEKARNNTRRKKQTKNRATDKLRRRPMAGGIGAGEVLVYSYLSLRVPGTKNGRESSWGVIQAGHSGLIFGERERPFNLERKESFNGHIGISVVYRTAYKFIRDACCYCKRGGGYACMCCLP